MVCLVWRLVGWEGEDGNERGKKETHTQRERAVGEQQPCMRRRE